MAGWLCKHREACLRGWVPGLWQQDKEAGRVMSYRHVLDMFPLRLALSTHARTHVHTHTCTHTLRCRNRQTNVSTCSVATASCIKSVLHLCMLIVMRWIKTENNFLASSVQVCYLAHIPTFYSPSSHSHLSSGILSDDKHRRLKAFVKK